MQGCDYGLTSRPSKLKNSQVRPQSQQRSSSLTHNDSLKKQLSTKPILVTRKSMQASTTGEYYAQQVQRRPFREFCTANRASTKPARDQAQNLEKVRKWFIQRLQRWMLELREQIHRQSAQIFNLERTIQRQNQEIETKNSILRTLIAKIQGGKRESRGEDSMCFRRVEDLQVKIGVIVQQIEEERLENVEKIEELGAKVIRHFGKELWKLKNSLSNFMQEKERSIHQIDKQMASLCSALQLKLKGMESSRERMSMCVRLQEHCKDSTSQSTQKESLSTLTQPEESFFFYPDQSTLRTIQQLIREREELPIRVFTDSSGRLKYWQSRTFIFDRRGNFSLPSSAQLSCMQQRGWIKVIASD